MSLVSQFMSDIRVRQYVEASLPASEVTQIQTKNLVETCLWQCSLFSFKLLAQTSHTFWMSAACGNWEFTPVNYPFQIPST